MDRALGTSVRRLPDHSRSAVGESGTPDSMRVLHITSANKSLDPTAVSVSVFMRFDFTQPISYSDHAVPAVGQLGR